MQIFKEKKNKKNIKANYRNTFFYFLKKGYTRKVFTIKITVYSIYFILISHETGVNDVFLFIYELLRF